MPEVGPVPTVTNSLERSASVRPFTSPPALPEPPAWEAEEGGLLAALLPGFSLLPQAARDRDMASARVSARIFFILFILS